MTPALPSQRLKKLDKPSDSEKQLECIHNIFEEQVAQTPEALAVACGEEQLTYAQLNQRTNQLAHYLQREGVGPETRIGVCLERSVDLIVSLLAILKAGGAYVPLDPSYPEERLSYIMEDAGIRCLVTTAAQHAQLPPSNHRIIAVDSEQPRIQQETERNLQTSANPENLAYVIYTSGSTGQPKGVGVTHQNVIRLFQATREVIHPTAQDVWTLFHSYAFDFSVWEIFAPLLHGGKMVIIPHWVSRAPDTFYELVMNEQVTILNQTPSAFQQFIRAEEAARTESDLALRLVIFGGEALDFQSLKPWWERHGDQVPQLINMYGITETTVHVTYRPLTLVDLKHAATSRIGNPIPDLQLYILDQFQQLVPIGVPGEIYIGGAGVTRGYINHPELTSARFIPNPYSQQAGARLYRSGDLARHLPCGDIAYLGRGDHQVKIRGFRIELGEIESVLAQYPEVRKAVAIVREDQLDDKRLVAYLVVADEATLIIPTLRTYLAQRLPSYMIPSTFMMLTSLPLTSNGKIDRERLPAPESSRENSDQPFEHARTPIEEKLVNIWKELLNVAQVGIRDSFFDLGGHSLTLTKLANRVQNTFQVRLPLRVIFDLPTIERMSQAIVEEQVKTADQVTVTHLLSKLSQLTPEQVSELLKG